MVAGNPGYDKARTLCKKEAITRRLCTQVAYLTSHASKSCRGLQKAVCSTSNAFRPDSGS